MGHTDHALALAMRGEQSGVPQRTHYFATGEGSGFSLNVHKGAASKAHKAVLLKSTRVRRREVNTAMRQFYVDFRVDGVLSSAYVSAPTYEEAFSEAEYRAHAQYPGMDVEVLAVQLSGES